MAYHKAAVEALKELGKAAVPAITKWIKNAPSSGIADFKPALLKAALKKAVEKGTIVQISASYTLPVGAEAGLSASYPRLARCPYKIECAKSNRSFCRASRKTIDTGALRLAPPLCKTGNDGDERAMWYALPALFEMFRDHPNAFWISSVEQIAGFDKLKPADKEVVQEHITALVEERKAAGAEPVHTVYTKPCWERRALIALVANDKAALKAALTEDGADVTTKVGSPRLGSNADGKFKESDVQVRGARLLSQCPSGTGEPSQGYRRAQPGIQESSASAPGTGVRRAQHQCPPLADQTLRRVAMGGLRLFRWCRGGRRPLLHGGREDGLGIGDVPGRQLRGVRRGDGRRLQDRAEGLGALRGRYHRRPLQKERPREVAGRPR